MITLQPASRDDIVVSFYGQYVLGREYDHEVSLWQGKEWDHSYIPFNTPRVMAFSPVELVLATDVHFYSVVY